MQTTHQSTPESTYDVAVIGAGVAGSALATALAQAGWRVALLERDRFPRHKVCGEFLSPEAQQSLRAFGLYDRIAALQPVPLHSATIVNPAGRRLSLALPGTAWGLSRYRFDGALAAGAIAQGAVLHSATTVRDYTYAQGDYQLHCRQDATNLTLQARALILASGRHSRLLAPQPAGPKQGNRWQRCVGIKAHYQAIQMGAETELYLVPGGYVGLNPVEGGVVNVCALLDYTSFARAGGDVLAALQRLVEWNPALATRLAGAIPLPATVCAVAPVDTKRAPNPWAGSGASVASPVACVGDTAAMIPPLCGDGMAMALRSAELCAPLADAFLRGECALAEWSTRYTTQWRQEFAQRLWWGQRLQSALSTPYLGDGLLNLGRLLPPVARYFVNVTRGVPVAKSGRVYASASAHGAA